MSLFLEAFLDFYSIRRLRFRGFMAEESPMPFPGLLKTLAAKGAGSDVVFLKLAHMDLSETFLEERNWEPGLGPDPRCFGRLLAEACPRLEVLSVQETLAEAGRRSGPGIRAPLGGETPRGLHHQCRSDELDTRVCSLRRPQLLELFRNRRAVPLQLHLVPRLRGLRGLLPLFQQPLHRRLVGLHRHYPYPRRALLDLDGNGRSEPLGEDLLRPRRPYLHRAERRKERLLLHFLVVVRRREDGLLVAERRPEVLLTRLPVSPSPR